MRIAIAVVCILFAIMATASTGRIAAQSEILAPITAQ